MPRSLLSYKLTTSNTIPCVSSDSDTSTVYEYDSQLLYWIVECKKDTGKFRTSYEV